MNTGRIIGKIDQHTQTNEAAVGETSSVVETFDGMSPGWALEWDLTTLTERRTNVEGPISEGLQPGGSLCGSNDQ